MRSGRPSQDARENSAAAKQLVPPQDDTASALAAGTAHPDVSQPYDRRVLLAARTLLRWGRPALFWPPDAPSLAEADHQWVIDVLVLVFTAAATAAALDEAAAAVA